LQGKLLWKFETGNAIEAPALIHENTVFIGNLDGTLFALDLIQEKKSGNTKPITRLLVQLTGGKPVE
jgi:outer membrane protein assembly factor BamB